MNCMTMTTGNDHLHYLYRAIVPTSNFGYNFFYLTFKFINILNMIQIPAQSRREKVY